MLNGGKKTSICHPVFIDDTLTLCVAQMLRMMNGGKKHQSVTLCLLMTP